jgi:hypothetical protein
MGFVVTGRRPAGKPDPPPAGGGNQKSSTAAAGAASTGDDGRASATVRALLWLPRFLLGNLGGIYYAVLPVFVYVKNELCGGSALAAAAALAVGVVGPLLHAVVLPRSFRPLGDDARLYGGIADFYNRSSGIWEQVWGEHMHSGYYGAEGTDVDKDPQQAQHDMMEQLLEFSGVDRSQVRDVLDIGCGVGGASRFLAGECPGASVTGVTLSPVQQARATALNEGACQRRPRGRCPPHPPQQPQPGVALTGISLCSSVLVLQLTNPNGPGIQPRAWATT